MSDTTKVVSGLPLGQHTVRISSGGGITINEQIKDAMKAMNDSIEYTFYGIGLDIKTSDFKGLSESVIEVDGITVKTQTKKNHKPKDVGPIFPTFMRDLEKI